MKARRVTAGRYAKALHAVAREAGTVEPVAAELAAFAEAFAASPELQGALMRPWIKPADRRRLAAEVAQRAGCGKTVQDFVALLSERGRLDHLREIVQAYGDLVDAAAGRARARVRSATALTEGERQRLTARLEGAVGKRIVLEQVIDSNLLGGFVAEIGSLVLDGSLDGQLARMREQLVRG